MKKIVYIAITLIILQACKAEEKTSSEEFKQTDTPSLNKEELIILQKGANLFTTHCAACHSQKLDVDSTAPALACIKGNLNRKYM